ncbi:MAG: ferredoxin Fer [Halobacteriales archaeon]
MPFPRDVLGVPEDADRERIERAYKRRIKDAHPDHGTAEEFQRVRAAYESLRNGDPPADAAGARASRARRRGGGRTRAGADGEPAGASTDRRTTEAATGATEPVQGPVTVRYLDYDVLADHGWDLDDADLFETAADANLGDAHYGQFEVEPDGSLLEAAESVGHEWPFACRGGACANCAVAVPTGELSMPANHVLPEEMLDRGIRLSCIGRPATTELAVVFNVKHLPSLEELRLPPTPFKRAYSDR